MPVYDSTRDKVQIGGVPIPSSGADTVFNFSWNGEQFAVSAQIHDPGSAAKDRATVSVLHDDTFVLTFMAPPDSSTYLALAAAWDAQRLRLQQLANGDITDATTTGRRDNLNSGGYYQFGQVVIERPQNDNNTAEVEDRMWVIKGVVTAYDLGSA